MIFEFKAVVPLAAVQQIEDALAELEEQSLMILEDKPTSSAWLVGYVTSREDGLTRWRALLAVYQGEIEPGIPEIRELPDRDWKDSYKAHFSASKFGRLNWVPIWQQSSFSLPEGEQVLWLDPGMAFGTGNHETTRLCCERLSAFVETRGTVGRVIDAGCGSGILALSAVKLGFVDVYGFDNDPEAVRVSHENAALNGLSGRARFQVEDLESGFDGGRTAELVMVNIQSDILIRFAGVITNGVSPHGQLVLSGVLGREVDEVHRVFAPRLRGWKFDSRPMGEWADLVFTG